MRERFMMYPRIDSIKNFIVDRIVSIDQTNHGVCSICTYIFSDATYVVVFLIRKRPMPLLSKPPFFL